MLIKGCGTEGNRAVVSSDQARTILESKLETVLRVADRDNFSLGTVLLHVCPYLDLAACRPSIDRLEPRKDGDRLRRGLLGLGGDGGDREPSSVDFRHRRNDHFFKPIGAPC